MRSPSLLCGSRLEQWAHATGGFTSMYVFGADRRLEMTTGTDLLKDAMFVFEGDFASQPRLKRRICGARHSAHLELELRAHRPMLRTRAASWIRCSAFGRSFSTTRRRGADARA